MNVGAGTADIFTIRSVVTSTREVRARNTPAPTFPEAPVTTTLTDPLIGEPTVGMWPKDAEA